MVNFLLKIYFREKFKSASKGHNPARIKIALDELCHYDFLTTDHCILKLHLFFSGIILCMILIIFSFK